MPDLLVKLYELPRFDGAAALTQKGIEVRRALPPERDLAIRFAGSFGPGWAAECACGFGPHPTKVFVAVEQGAIIGFACHDVTAIGFFGPTGVLESARGQGVGEALLFAVMEAMRAAGHAYAIIGGAGPVAWYQDRLNTLEIPDSEPGIYRNMVTGD